MFRIFGTVAGCCMLAAMLVFPMPMLANVVSMQVGREHVTRKLDDAQSALRDAWIPMVRDGGPNPNLSWPQAAPDSFPCAGGSVKDCIVTKAAHYEAVGGFAASATTVQTKAGPQPAERDLIVRIVGSETVFQAGKAPDVRATGDRYVMVRVFPGPPYVTADRASDAAVDAARKAAVSATP